MDALTNRYLEKYEASKLDSQLGLGKRNDQSDDEFDSDSLLQELEDELESDDNFLKKYRESRLTELSNEIGRSKRAIERLDSSDIPYREITNEGELIKLTSQSEKVVILFFDPRFKTCQMLDQSFEQLAYKNVHTKFYKIEASNAPFLAVKLGVKVLPCTVMYKNGLELSRIIGLQGLISGENVNNFKIENLESLLLLNGMIEKKSFDLKKIRNKRAIAEDQDYESDLDL